MRVNINFHTDNDAFQASDNYAEVERVLSELALTVAQHSSGNIRDINGNTVGTWSWND